MKRRSFLKSTAGFGFMLLPGLGLLDPQEADQLCKQTSDSGSAKAPDLDEIISRGDILRNIPPSTEKSAWVPLYQGNGRFGSCYGPWGLHEPPGTGNRYTINGATRFTHMKHFGRGKFNADYLLPVAFMYWQSEPAQVKSYNQFQSFFDGTVTTSFHTDAYSINITSWFDPVNRDLAGFRIAMKGSCPDIIVSSPRAFPAMYNQQLTAEVKSELSGETWTADIKCLNANSRISVTGNAAMQQVAEGVKLSLREGENLVLIAVNGDIDVSPALSLKRTTAWWNKTWKRTGWLDLPDEGAQKIWVRSLAYSLYSHNDDGLGCSPPTGLAGNAWPFPFPFDSGCRHLLLLSTGQVETAKKWIEFWHSKMQGLKEYTRRMYNSEGIFMPHVFPYGPAGDYHKPEVPNYYYYPIYNSALMARMADETAVMVNDARWTKSFAEPLIGEAAKFYLAHLKKGDDGFWHLHLIPSISLDESGKTDKPDYVTGLISAQYALTKAVEYGLDPGGKMKEVLTEGLAFKGLLAENGMYYNHLGQQLSDFGKQKHADQLFPLVHLPLMKTPDTTTRRAAELRYDITAGAKDSRFIGHTLGEFLLASTRMHDVAAWRLDWSMITPSRYTDAEWIQFYESTGNNLAFYVTTHGLFAQALLETVVSAWWDELHLGACVPWKEKIRFGNIRTLTGITVSGELVDGSGTATLHAWKDCAFSYNGKKIHLKKGKKLLVKINA
jgi:hypothetical protein